ncbi:unnamed protein product, partial [Boreogadus saida]
CGQLGLGEGCGGTGRATPPRPSRRRGRRRARRRRAAEDGVPERRSNGPPTTDQRSHSLHLLTDDGFRKETHGQSRPAGSTTAAATLHVRFHPFIRARTSGSRLGREGLENPGYRGRTRWPRTAAQCRGHTGDTRRPYLSLHIGLTDRSRGRRDLRPRQVGLLPRPVLPLSDRPPGQRAPGRALGPAPPHTPPHGGAPGTSRGPEGQDVRVQTGAAAGETYTPAKWAFSRGQSCPSATGHQARGPPAEPWGPHPRIHRRTAGHRGPPGALSLASPKHG